MQRAFSTTCLTLLIAATCAVAVDGMDVRRGVPDDVYLVVYRRQNPERADVRKHYQEVWKTVQETKIIDRFFDALTSGMSAERREQARGILKRLREEIAPIDLPTLMDVKEVIYARSAQMSPVPFFHHLVIVRATPEAAASLAEGTRNLFAMAEDYTDGKFVKLVEGTEGEARVCGIQLPDHLPLQPAAAQLGDLFVFSSSKDLLRRSLALRAGAAGPSKFDDPRLAASLEQLPEMEDGLVFYDGGARLAALRGFGPFLQAVSDGDENVGRFVAILDKVWDDVGLVDYEVTVEYTEGNLHRSASYGKLLPQSRDATLRKVVCDADPIEQWYAWVPANALSCSLGTGLNLHPLYERTIAILKNDVPASADLLTRFEEMQQSVDVYLDADILQSFSGEYVAVSLPSAGGGRPDRVLALRCSKPERIRDLIHRAVAAVQRLDFPQVKALQLELVECKELPGFEALSAAAFTVLQMRPVVGFQNDWLCVGTSAGAVKAVLDTKAGHSQTIEGSEAFRRLGLDVNGPLQSVAYVDSAERTHNLAKTLGQLGFTTPLLMSAAGVNAKQAQLRPVQQTLALLPDVARIVRQFDFVEAQATVVQAGTEPDTYQRRSVTLVRPYDGAHAAH